MLNLSLNGSYGSYGLIGSLNMAKFTISAYPEIKNIIFIQTYDIWHRPFSRQGFFETSKNINTQDIGNDFFPTYKIVDKLRFQTNILEILMFSKHIFRKDNELFVVHDYVYAKDEWKTYKNGELMMEAENKLYKKNDLSKSKVFKAIDLFCGLEDYNCIFMHGPVHEVLYKNTAEDFFVEINKIISTAEHISVITVGFPVDNKNMGSSDNHVDISYKKEMTRLYFEELKSYLK